MDAFLKKTNKDKPAVLDVTHEEKYSTLITPSCSTDRSRKAISGTLRPSSVTSQDREKVQKKESNSSTNAVANVTPDCAVWNKAPTVTATKLPLHPMFLASVKVTSEKQKLPVPLKATKEQPVKVTSEKQKLPVPLKATKEQPPALKIDGKDNLSKGCKIESSDKANNKTTHTKVQNSSDPDLASKQPVVGLSTSTKSEKTSRKHPIGSKSGTDLCILKSSNQLDLSTSPAAVSKCTSKLEAICTVGEVFEIIDVQQKKRRSSGMTSSGDRSGREVLSNEHEELESIAAVPDDSRRSKRQASIADSNAQCRRVREQLSREADDDDVADFIADSGAYTITDSQHQVIFLHCYAIYCTTLLCTAMYCAALRCNAMHCTVQSSCLVTEKSN